MISWMRYIKKTCLVPQFAYKSNPNMVPGFYFFSSLNCRVSFGSRVVSLDRFHRFFYDCSINFRQCWVESENWPILQFYRHFFLALRKRFFYLLIEKSDFSFNPFFLAEKCVFLFVSYFHRRITGNWLWESVAKMTQLVQWDSLKKL